MFIDYLIDVLGDYKQATTDYRFCCPFCEDSKYRLYVSNKEGKSNWYHCFHCGASGQPIKFTMQYLHVGYKEAIDTLAVYDYTPDAVVHSFHIDPTLSAEEQLLSFISQMDSVKSEEEDDSKEQYVCPLLPSGYVPLANNMQQPEAQPFISYLYNRGFTYEDIVTHGIGYVLSCYVPINAEKNILIQNHVVFLTFNDYGEVIYWNTRAISDNPVIKSVNAPVGENTYSKGTVVFNLNRAKKEPVIVITEGVPDAITLRPYGIATFGKAVTDEQIHLITKDLNEHQKLYIMLDEDAKKVAMELAQRILPYHKNTFIVINPTKKDANSLGSYKAWECIVNNSVSVDVEGQLLRLIL